MPKNSFILILILKYLFVIKILPMKQVKLNSGCEMPMVGLGTWQLENKEELLNALEEAYKLGYRHIDTAKAYGNEEVIGEFLKKHDRKEFFITSKLWNSDHEHVLDGINSSLQKLGIDYLDLYLIHWPVNFNGPFNLENVWRQMEELVPQKKARSIGVSNFGVKNMTKLLSFCKIKPAVLQVELHPYLPQHEIRDLCNKNSIQVISYSSLGSSGGDHDVILTKDPVIVEIAQKHTCPVQTVILGFLISENIIVIPRSKSKEHLKTNMDAANLNLSDDEKKRIREIKTRHRYVEIEEFGEHRFD